MAMNPDAIKEVLDTVFSVQANPQFAVNFFLLLIQIPPTPVELRFKILYSRITEHYIQFTI